MDLRLTGYTIGFLLIVIGMAELAPGIVDLFYGSTNALSFFVNAFLCSFVGGILLLVNYSEDFTLSIRQAFLLTTLSWLSMSLFASFPLYTSDLELRFVDAFFESLSGITTTGSTVLSGLDAMSPGILLWRSMTQWIGGIGIVAFAIVLLPFLQIGGMQLFRTESSDKSEKIMPRSKAVVMALLKIYVGLTVMCILTYHALGMTWFDAINHGLTTIPTGGYSTHDASFGYFESSSLQVAATIFMLLGGIPFVLYVRMIFQGRFELLKDDQVRAILPMLLVFIGVLTIWLYETSEYGFGNSAVLVAFNVISVITTTGYATADYTTWGAFAVTSFFMLTYLGACAGSTSGGLKVMRIVILSKALKKHVNKLMYPSGVFAVRYQGKSIPHEVVMTVFGFLGLYVTANVFLSLALGWTGLDMPTAISAAATALANVGPGIGDTIGPAGNFSTLSDTAKWLICAGMMLGRLEILTVLVLFTQSFWRV